MASSSSQTSKGNSADISQSSHHRLSQKSRTSVRSSSENIIYNDSVGSIPDSRPSSLVSNSSTFSSESQQVTHSLSHHSLTPMITTTAPTYPSNTRRMSTPLQHSSDGAAGAISSGTSTRHQTSHPRFSISKITKRSSQMIRSSNKRLAGLSASLLGGAGIRGSTLSINSYSSTYGGAEDRQSLASDAISIGKRSLDLKAAIMGKFLVKVSAVEVASLLHSQYLLLFKKPYKISCPSKIKKNCIFIL